jgi:hypothetical protein
MKTNGPSESNESSLYRLRLVGGRDIDSPDLLWLLEQARRLNCSRSLPVTKCLLRVERRGERIKLVELATFPATKGYANVGDDGEPTQPVRSAFERRPNKEGGGKDHAD